MSGTVKLWCFILLLPFFAAIGHDFYANYLIDPQKKAKLEAFDIDPQAYQLSDLGYLLVTYVPEAYENSRLMVGEESWTKYVDPVLREFTFVVALVPAAIFYLYLILAKLFGLPPFTGVRLGRTSEPTGKYDGVFKDRDKEANFKYKRR